ncbi:MAG: glutamate--tRNA ligase, partial [Christensenellales bacterium]
FILRIEDTDQKRFVEGATEVIYETLRQTHLTHDEGPDIGGEFGPYVQSERKDLYKKYAEMLVQSGHAYYCFCTKDEEEKEREKETEEQGFSTGYNRHCRNLSKEEIDANLKAGKPYVIRQKIPLDGTTTFHDEVFGDVTVENSTLDDQVLLKSDGMPTYNFANVVDDHLMNITHVMRGREYIASTPKYQLLYEAFGWEPPKTAHLSTIMGKNADGSISKLSKRHGSVSFAKLIEEGYLPEAITNYIALLGWSPKQEREFFTLDELCEHFTLEGLVKTNAIFDYDKLAWMNGEYIKNLSHEKFVELSRPYAKDLPDFIKDKWEYVSTLIQTRINKLSEIYDKLSFLGDFKDFDLSLLINKKNKTTLEGSFETISECLPRLEGITNWTVENINNSISEYSAQKEQKIGYVMWPLRIGVTGEVVTPGGTGEMMFILGKEETLHRLKATKQRIEKAI